MFGKPKPVEVYLNNSGMSSKDVVSLCMVCVMAGFALGAGYILIRLSQEVAS